MRRGSLLLFVFLLTGCATTSPAHPVSQVKPQYFKVSGLENDVKVEYRQGDGSLWYRIKSRGVITNVYHEPAMNVCVSVELKDSKMEVLALNTEYVTYRMNPGESREFHLEKVARLRTEAYMITNTVRDGCSEL